MRNALVPSSFWDLKFPSFFDDDWVVDVPSSDGLTVSEDENSVYVEAMVPGLSADDVEVTFDKGVLWIRGEKSESEEDSKRKFYRRSSRNFSYRVMVPGEVDQEAEPEATYDKGVMHVTFSKKQKAEPKRIKVTQKE